MRGRSNVRTKYHSSRAVSSLDQLSPSSTTRRDGEIAVKLRELFAPGRRYAEILSTLSKLRYSRPSGQSIAEKSSTPSQHHFTQKSAWKFYETRTFKEEQPHVRSRINTCFVGAKRKIWKPPWWTWSQQKVGADVFARTDWQLERYILCRQTQKLHDRLFCSWTLRRLFQIGNTIRTWYFLNELCIFLDKLDLKASKGKIKHRCYWRCRLLVSKNRSPDRKCIIGTELAKKYNFNSILVWKWNERWDGEPTWTSCRTAEWLLRIRIRWRKLE